MKKNILSMMAGALLVAELTACGGSGSNLPTDGIFGELPAAVGDYEEQMYDAFESALSSDFRKEWISKCKEIDSVAMDAVFVEAEKLKDKDFATEIDPGIPWKMITPFKLDIEHSKVLSKVGEASIQKIPSSSTHICLSLVCEVENTEQNDPRPSFNVFFIDKNGVPFYPVRNTIYSTSPKDVDPGSRGKCTIIVDITPWNVKLLSKANKILIKNDSKLWRDLWEIRYSVEKAYEKRFEEIFKNR